MSDPVSIPLWAAIIVPLSCGVFGFLICALMTMAGRGE